MKKLLALISLLSLPALAAYQPSVPQAGFVTTNTLASGGNYDSGYINAQGFNQLQTHVVASHDGTMTFSFSETSDGSDIVRTLVLPYVAANGYQLFSAPVFSDYVQYSFTNTSGQSQTDFYYETKLMRSSVSPQILRLDGSIAGGMMAQVGRSVLMGKTEGGNYYDNVAVHDGNIEVGVMEPRSAFGEVSVIEPTPVAQIDAVYNTVNSLFMSTNASGAGTVSAANQMFAISTGADSNSSASAYSKRYAKYRPGQGVLSRWTALYSANAANSYTFSGMLDANQNANGFGFGYTNTTFGAWHWNGGTYTHIPQTSWNLDTMLGGGGATNKSGILLDPTKLNVYQVRLTYLGAGNIDYFIMSPTNGQFIKVHSLSYPNLNTSPSLAQPSLNVGWRAVNGAESATEKIVRGASAAMFVEGFDRVSLGPIHGEDAFIDEFPQGGVTNLLAIRNATSFNGKVNRARIKLRTLSLGSSAGTGASSEGAAIVRLLLNPSGTLTNFTMVSGASADQGVTITAGESVASFDKANSAMSGGSKEFIATVSLNNSQTLDLEGYNLFINPADVVSFAVEVKGSDQDVTVGVTWSEEL